MGNILSVLSFNLIVTISFLFFPLSICSAESITTPYKQFGIGVLRGGACISPDGSKFLTGSSDGNVRLWDAATGALIHTFSGHTKQIRTAEFSPDGSKMLSCSDDLTAILWNVMTGEVIRTFSGFPELMCHACFIPDSTKIIVGSKFCFLCDVETGSIIDTLSMNQAVHKPTFSSDGSMILINGLTTLLKNFKTGDTVGIFEPRNSGLTSSIFPEGSMAVFSDYFKIMLWDITTDHFDTNTAFKDSSEEIDYLTFSHDGSRLLCYDETGVLRLWDSKTKELIKTFKDTNDVCSIDPYGGGTLISISADDSKFLTTTFDKVKLWDVESGNLINSFSMHSGYICSIAYSHDGSKILVGRDNYLAELLDAETGNLLHTFHLNGYPSIVAFSPDDSMILTNFDDTTVILLDAQNGNSIKTFSMNSKTILSAAFSPDGSKILTRSNMVVKLWKAQTGDSIRSFSAFSGPISLVAFSPNGSKIITSEYSNLYTVSKIWDVETGDSLKSFRMKCNNITSMTVSSDSSMLVTGRYDGNITLWDIQSGDSIRTIHTNQTKINLLAFTPDDLEFVSSSSGAIELWEVATGNLIGSFVVNPYSSNVNYAALSPDGTKVLGGYGDGVVRIWNLSDLTTSRAHHASAGKTSSVFVKPASNNMLEIGLASPVSSRTSLTIYTVSGRKVASFSLKKSDSGSFKVALPADMGRGCYYFRYVNGGEIHTGKFLVVR